MSPRHLLPLLFLLPLLLAGPARAEPATSEWHTLDIPASVGIYAINDESEFFFVTCPNETDACQYSFALGVDCDEGGPTPVLLSSDQGAATFDLHCVHASGRAMPVIVHPHPEKLFAGVERMALALGSGPGEFWISRFTLTGFDAALADLQKRHQARRAAAKP